MPFAPLLALWLAAPAPSAGFAPRAVALPAGLTVAEAAERVSVGAGFPVQLAGVDPRKRLTGPAATLPAWAALERLAAGSGARLQVANQGRRVELVPLPPGGVKALSSVDGPFRTVVRQVTARRDPDTGRTVTEVQLEVNWEPRLVVVRHEGEPKLTAAEDDRGTKFALPAARSKTTPRAGVMALTVRLDGVPRQASKLTRLEGEFTVTAAEELLTARFAKLNPPSPPVAKSGVTVTLSPPARVQSRWDVSVTLDYPPSAVEFESFEAGLAFADNRLQLIGPTGRAFDPLNFDLSDGGRRAVATYRFAAEGPKGVGDLAGFSAAYLTPSPLREFAVRFRFVDVLLP